MTVTVAKNELGQILFGKGDRLVIFDADVSIIAHMMEHPWSAFAALCWLIVAIGATIAVLSPMIRDTLLERVALAGIAIGATGRAWYVFGRGVLPLDGVILAGFAAFYVVVLFWKHIYIIPRRADYTPSPKCKK